MDENPDRKISTESESNEEDDDGDNGPTLRQLGLWADQGQGQQSGSEDRGSVDDDAGLGDTLTEKMLVDIEGGENGAEGINNGTQTPEDQLEEEEEVTKNIETLSFEDPRLFQLDEILGPDEKILSKPASLITSKKRKKSSSSLKSLNPQTSSPNKQLEDDDDDQEDWAQLYPFEPVMMMTTDEETEGEGRSDDHKKFDLAHHQTEILGEVDENDDGGSMMKEDKERKTSLENFEELYMTLSDDKCVSDRLSRDALQIPSRHSTPSPPGSPKVRPRLHECPSIESFFKLGDKVSIHFLVLPGKKIYSKDIRLDTTILQIKQELERIVRVPAQFLELRRNKNLVMDYKTVKECGGRSGKKLQFTVEINKRAIDEWQLQVPMDTKIEPRPPVERTLRVQQVKGWKSINVTIEYPNERKLFLGGYRDKVTRIEYHHAFTQTPIVKKELKEHQEHKATQAFHETNNCMQTPVEAYTQVDRSDYYVTCQHQKFVRPRPYRTAAWWERQREKAAIVIQKYWRRWLAEREREERLTGLIKRVEWAEHMRKGRTEIRLAIKDDELYRQYNPSSLLDIELLYRAINLWRKQEIDYVLTNRWGAEKKAALAEIMEKEADLLLDLERAKSKIMNDKRSHLIEDLYKKMGNPTRWLTRTGKFVTLDTPQKAQARVLHDLYHELQTPVTDYEQRLILLGKLYNLVKEHRTVTAEYLVQLIGREITLMQRKARERLLIGLRKRILNGFFAICRDTTFNVEAGILQKVPFDVMKLRKDMKQCKGCRRMLYRDQFMITRGVTVTSRCLTCMGLYRTCILRVDLNLYRRMLQELRQDEQEQGFQASVSYLIDAYDLQFLIEQIWHGQSALSGIDDRYLLRICRWIKNKPWTPWNCVLLTEEEAVAHLHIDDMLTAYQQSFFNKVRLRHNAARNYFERIAKTSLKLDTNLQVYCLNQEVNKRIDLQHPKRKFFRKKSASIFAA